MSKTNVLLEIDAKIVKDSLHFCGFCTTIKYYMF